MPQETLSPLLVLVTREVGLDWFTMHLPDGSTEDVDAEEAVEWFRLRHSGRMDLTLIERAIDDAWNFGESEVLIQNPRRPAVEVNRTTPKV
jgi:hypothetical protein